MKFKIKYGIGETMGSMDEEIIEAASYGDAIDRAYFAAIEVYETYEGLHGIPDVQSIIDECGLSEEEAEEEYLEERESWLEYSAKQVKETKE